METLHALAGLVAGVELPDEEEAKIYEYFDGLIPQVCCCALLLQPVFLKNGRFFGSRKVSHKGL